MSISAKGRGGHLGPVPGVQPLPHQVHQGLHLVQQLHRLLGGLLQEDQDGRCDLMCKIKKCYIFRFFVILIIPVSCPADPPLLFLEHFELPSPKQVVVHNCPEIAISPSLVAFISSPRLPTRLFALNHMESQLDYCGKMWLTSRNE